MKKLINKVKVLMNKFFNQGFVIERRGSNEDAYKEEYVLWHGPVAHGTYKTYREAYADMKALVDWRRHCLMSKKTYYNDNGDYLMQDK